jgi:Tfp pilus assembly protein PilF
MKQQNRNDLSCLDLTFYALKTRLHSLFNIKSLLKSRPALIALAACLAFCAHAPADEMSKKSGAQIQFEQGLSALHAKDYVQAEASFKKTLELNPKFAAAYLGLADLRQSQGKPAEAGVYLQKAVAIAPQNTGVQTAWGQFLSSQKRYAEAEKALQRAVQLDPKAPLPHELLGDLYLMSLKKPQEAIVAYRACLSVDPTNPKASFMLGTALLAVGKTQEAEEQLSKTSEQNPANLAVRKTLADLQLRNAELDAALASYNKILQIAPNSTFAQIGIGDVMMQRKDYERASTAYNTALANAPRSTEAQTKLAMVQELKGDNNSAERSYRSALEMDPKNAVAANNLAWLLGVKEQKPKEALLWAQKAVAANPKNANFLDTEGWLAHASGDTATALLVLKKAQALSPQDPGILYHLGILYQETGKLPLANESFSRALAINPTFNGAADARARLDAIGPHQ